MLLLPPPSWGSSAESIEADIKWGDTSLILFEYIKRSVITSLKLFGIVGILSSDLWSTLLYCLDYYFFFNSTLPLKNVDVSLKSSLPLSSLSSRFLEFRLGLLIIMYFVHFGLKLFYSSSSSGWTFTTLPLCSLSLSLTSYFVWFMTLFSNSFCFSITSNNAADTLLSTRWSTLLTTSFIIFLTDSATLWLITLSMRVMKSLKSHSITSPVLSEYFLAPTPSLTYCESELAVLLLIRGKVYLWVAVFLFVAVFVYWVLIICAIQFNIDYIYNINHIAIWSWFKYT